MPGRGGIPEAEWGGIPGCGGMPGRGPLAAPGGCGIPNDGLGGMPPIGFGGPEEMLEPEIECGGSPPIGLGATDELGILLGAPIELC